MAQRYYKTEPHLFMILEDADAETGMGPAEERAQTLKLILSFLWSNYTFYISRIRIKFLFLTKVISIVRGKLQQSKAI